MWAHRSLWVFCSQGCRYITALAIAHPQLGFAVGTEMALQLMSLAKGVLGPIFFNLPSLDVLCGGGGVVAQRFGVRVRVCQSYFARPGRPSGRRRADYTRCIGSHYLSLDRFLSGCVRPSMESVMQVSFLPPSPAGRKGCARDCRLTTD